MTPGIRPLIAGNWKMNGIAASLNELTAISEKFASIAGEKADALICVPATLLSRAAFAAQDSVVMLGGQDCHQKESGAHTGDVSAEMLKDAGARAVLVGHSERRTDHNESNEVVKAKAEAALKAGLLAVVCIGETESERRSGKTLSVLSAQLEGSVPQGATSSNIVIAYEPVWAIGSGLTPSVDDVAEAHAHIRKELVGIVGEDNSANMRLLYGGSVKPSNALELLSIENVDGALIGGASLKASDFLAIAQASPE